MTCDRWEVVVVPFPFVERAGAKRRPALVLSELAFNREGHSILSMITTRGHAPWPGDVAIQQMELTGLRSPSLVRLKLFTLDNRLVLRTIGRLDPTDSARVSRSLATFLPHSP